MTCILNVFQKKKNYHYVIDPNTKHKDTRLSLSQAFNVWHNIVNEFCPTTHTSSSSL